MHSMQEQEVARIKLVAKLEFLPATITYVRDVAAMLGLAEADTGRLELVVEEACMNVIEHAFEPGELGSFEVIILRKPGQIVVAVEDRGLPFDFRKIDTDRESGLGIMLMKAFADEIRFLNLGRGGKRVELVKNLPYKDIGAYLSEDEKKGALPAEPAQEDIEITIRPMKPGDAVSLSRCVYRCYGYTYANGDLYFPGRVKELLESGLLLSHVALNPEGEVIGHSAIRREHPGDRVGERGQAVVDPRYRGHGLLNKLLSAVVENARKIGMYGNYSEGVTVHTFSQKAAISIGARETGILLGFTPATMFFKQIQEGERELRQTAVLFYTKLNDEPCRDVYLPFHHEGIIRRIYEMNNCRRNIRGAADAGEQAGPATTSRVDVTIQTDAGRAFMHITQFGADLVELVKFRLRELCLRRIDCIYLDLPLSNRVAQWSCANMEMLGFFFGGIVPELHDGDVLRLQYLNNVDVDAAKIQIASDFGKELLNYVIRARAA